MSQYAVIVLGDWPAQFYTRQAVFSSCDLPRNDIERKMRISSSYGISPFSVIDLLKQGDQILCSKF